jgi:tetrahydromethanopterin S-methyltransferase subunit F
LNGQVHALHAAVKSLEQDKAALIARDRQSRK